MNSGRVGREDKDRVGRVRVRVGRVKVRVGGVKVRVTSRCTLHSCYVSKFWLVYFSNTV